MIRPELAIIGAGPAGVSAALWARGLSLSARLIERGDGPGGQLHMVHFRPRDVAGVMGVDGPGLARRYREQLEEAGVDVTCGASAVSLEPAADATSLPAVRLSDGTRLESAAVLIATGARRRRLDAVGAEAYRGRGVSYSATRDRALLAGRDVTVVGGGDAAFENALNLAALGCSVRILSRGVPRARPDFRSRVASEPSIQVEEGVRVLEVSGSGRVERLRIADPRGEREIACEALVVKIGVIPNSEWCREAVAVNATGTIRIDARFATSAERIWAAGDVAGPLLPSIPVAMAQGAQAVAVIRERLHGH